MSLTDGFAHLSAKWRVRWSQSFSSRGIAMGFAWAGGGVRGHMEAIERYSANSVTLFPDAGLAAFSNEDYRRNLVHEKLTQRPLQSFRIVHSHVDPLFIRSCQRARQHSIPWVHTYHTLYFPEDWGGQLQPWQEEINQSLTSEARHADVRISISPWLQELLRERYGIETEVIPNGVDIERCDAALELNQRMPSNELKDYVLFSGSLSSVKNPGLFVDLACLLPDYHFVMIGGDLTPDKVSERCRQELPGNLTLAGPLSRDLALSFTKSARVLVVTSHSEGLPTVVMEAMAMGTRVVVPNSFGCRDLVEHETTGFLYEPGNLTDLTEQLRVALDSSSTEGPARQAIASIYAWPIVASQLDNVYESLLT